MRRIPSVLPLMLMIPALQPIPAADPADPGRPEAVAEQGQPANVVLVIHGRAGVLTLEEMKEAGLILLYPVVERS